MLIRLSFAFLVSALTCASLLAADVPKGKSDDVAKSAMAEQVAEIDKGVTEATKKAQVAQTQLTLYQNANRKKLQDLIQENPDDPAVADAAMLLIQKFHAPVDGDLLEKISKSLLSNAKAGEFCLKLTRPNPQIAGQENILKQVAELHENADARGMAMFALGCYNRMVAQASEADEAKQMRCLADAEQYLAKVKSDFAGIAATPYLRSTIGETIDGELVRVRNLPNLKVGKIAPEIAGLDIDGNPLKLSDSRGKATVLIFWGSWCGPCMGLVPHEKELFTRMQGKPFAMVSVNCGDTKEKAQATRADKEMPWRCWWDGGTTAGPIQAIYNVPHYPRIFVIDPKGVIRNIDVRHQELDNAVDKLIAEMNANKVSQR